MLTTEHMFYDHCLVGSIKALVFLCPVQLYGGHIAGKLLSHFGRLFTTFLQQHTGFTLGPEDIIVLDKVPPFASLKHEHPK